MFHKKIYPSPFPLPLYLNMFSIRRKKIELQFWMINLGEGDCIKMRGINLEPPSTCVPGEEVCDPHTLHRHLHREKRYLNNHCCGGKVPPKDSPSPPPYSRRALSTDDITIVPKEKRTGEPQIRIKLHNFCSITFCCFLMDRACWREKKCNEKRWK